MHVYHETSCTGFLDGSAACVTGGIETKIRSGKLVVVKSLLKNRTRRSGVSHHDMRCVINSLSIIAHIMRYAVRNSPIATPLNLCQLPCGMQCLIKRRFVMRYIFEHVKHAALESRKSTRRQISKEERNYHSIHLLSWWKFERSQCSWILEVDRRPWRGFDEAEIQTGSQTVGNSSQSRGSNWKAVCQSG